MSLNKTESDNNAAIDEVASLWAARLDGSTLGTKDRDALDAWLAEDPAHRAALAQYCQFSADLEQELPPLVSAGLVEMPTTQLQPSRRSFALPYFIVAGTLAAAAAIVVAFRWNAAPASLVAPAGAEYATAAGEQKTVVLADGSTVEMNAQTRFTFENAASSRRVHLVSGEAFFSVARLSPVKPFLVDTAAGTIRVTGTHFAVRAESKSQLEVTVEEGSVEVTASPVDGADSAPHALKANDRLTVRSGLVSQSTLSADDLARALRWRQGRVEFDATPLVEAAAQFERFSGRRIHVSPAVAQLEVQSSYDLKDFDGFVRELGPVLGFRASTGSDGEITLEAR